MSQQRDYKNSFESRQRAALSALVLLVALVLSCLGAAVAVSKALKGTEMNLAQAQIGSMIYVAAAYILFAVYMAVYQRDTFDGAKLMTMVCIQLALMPWMQVLGNMLEPHVTPMVMAALLIAELVNHKTALAAGVLLGLESAVLAGGKEGIFTTAAAVMMAANIASCAASVFALKRINTRGGMIAASGIGGAAGRCRYGGDIYRPWRDCKGDTHIRRLRAVFGAVLRTVRHRLADDMGGAFRYSDSGAAQ